MISYVDLLRVEETGINLKKLAHGHYQLQLFSNTTEWMMKYDEYIPCCENAKTV